MYQYENPSKTNSKKSTTDTSTISKSNVNIDAKMPVQLKSLFSPSFSQENDSEKSSLNNIPHSAQPMPFTYSPLQMQLMPEQEHREIQPLLLKMNENQEKLAPIPAKPNKTGIPLQMKEKYENLSGFSFDNVKVHYNSDKPAQLQALAYTQGNQVYIASGQEKYLRHELGHVVQQKQGRVQATINIGGLPLNDNAVLEREADTYNMNSGFFHKNHLYSRVIQCAFDDWYSKKYSALQSCAKKFFLMSINMNMSYENTKKYGNPYDQLGYIENKMKEFCKLSVVSTQSISLITQLDNILFEIKRNLEIFIPIFNENMLIKKQSNGFFKKIMSLFLKQEESSEYKERLEALESAKLAVDIINDYIDSSGDGIPFRLSGIPLSPTEQAVKNMEFYKAKAQERYNAAFNLSKEKSERSKKIYLGPSMGLYKEKADRAIHEGQILKVPDNHWTMQVNRAFIGGGIDAQLRFKIYNELNGDLKNKLVNNEFLNVTQFFQYCKINKIEKLYSNKEYGFTALANEIAQLMENNYVFRIIRGRFIAFPTIEAFDAYVARKNEIEERELLMQQDHDLRRF